MFGSTALAARVTADVISPPGDDGSHQGDCLRIDTRFGRMEISPSHVIHFVSGLLGFAQAREFVVVQPGDPKHQLFRILQCVNDPTLSFIVFPPSPDSGLIDAADIAAAASALGYQRDDLVVLLLVTVRRGSEGHALTVNLRAPVLIDAGRFRGAQYVLHNERYEVRHPL
jgi:flagellar assembly factor FliW